MLLLTRKVGQGIEIRPDVSVHPQTPVSRLFEAGPISISVAAITPRTVQLGVQADPRLMILCEELLHQGSVEVLSALARQALAQKLRLLRFIAKLSREQLAESANVGLTTVVVAETGIGVIALDDVERLARALGISVSELLRPPGNSWEERVVMALLNQGTSG